MNVLVLNAGSSSQKSCLYNIDTDLPDRPSSPLWEAKVDWPHHQGAAELTVKTASGTVQEALETNSREVVLSRMLTTLWEGKTQVLAQPSDVAVVGHRVVHGGQDYYESIVITPQVKETIARLATFAPLHNPANLEGIVAVERILGTSIPQVAVFDTAFHSQLPLPAAVYPIPYSWFSKGIRRYGFHGISYQYCSQRSAQLLERPLDTLRLIICHLGNGCSLAAIRNGRSIDTTMGFTPLEGLMMGTRSGSIDPGILLYLLREENFSGDELGQMLNRESGLKGVSGVSNDMRQITAAVAANNAQAQLAFDAYIHRLRSAIGGMVATLGGLDALVFTAGVGENSPAVRSAACETLAFLGLELDAAKNQQSPVDQDIATANSAVRVLVVKTEEDWTIAQECWRLVRS
mgnify:CR=1 FL=1